MQFDDVILGRRSIRGYKADPVPKALIEEILGLAMRAPSSMNTQPWSFYVISGEPLDRIRAGNTERNLAGVPHSREFRIGQPFDRGRQAAFRGDGHCPRRQRGAAGLGAARLSPIRCAGLRDHHL